MICFFDLELDASDEISLELGRLDLLEACLVFKKPGDMDQDVNQLVLKALIGRTDFHPRLVQPC